MSGFGVIDDAYKTLGVPVAPQSTNVTATVGATVVDIRNRTSQTDSNINASVAISGSGDTTEAQQQEAALINGRAIATSLVSSAIGEEASSRVISVAQALSTNPELAAGADINMLTQPMLVEAEVAVQQAEAYAASVVGENEKAIANAKAIEARSMLDQAKEEVKRAQVTSASAIDNNQNTVDSFTQAAQASAEGKTSAQQIAEKALSSSSASKIGGGGGGGLGIGSILGMAIGGVGALGTLGVGLPGIPGIPSLAIPGLDGLNIDKLLSSIKIPSLPEINLPSLPSIPNPLSMVQDALAGLASLIPKLTLDTGAMISAALGVAPPLPKVPQIPIPPLPPIPPIPSIAIPEVPIDMINAMIALPTDLFYGLGDQITSMMADSAADLEAKAKAAQEAALAEAEAASAAAQAEADAASAAAQAEADAATAAAEGAAEGAAASASSAAEGAVASASSAAEGAASSAGEASASAVASAEKSVESASKAGGPMGGTVTAVAKVGNTTVIQPPAGGIQVL